MVRTSVFESLRNGPRSAHNCAVLHEISAVEHSAHNKREPLARVELFTLAKIMSASCSQAGKKLRLVKTRDAIYELNTAIKQGM